MELTLLFGYPDNVGRRQIFCGHGHGPASYSRTTPDILQPPVFQFYFDAVFPAVSVSGRYIVYAIPEGVGPRQEWKIKWKHFDGDDGGDEVPNGHNLSGEVVQLAGFGGLF